MSVNKETQHKDYQYNSKQISLLNLKLSELSSQFSNSALAFREIITPVQNLNDNISQLKGEINKLSYSNNDPMNVTDSTHRVAQNQQLDDYIRQIFSTNIKNVIRGLFVLVGATTSAMLFEGDRGIGGFAGLATFESIDLSLKTLYQIAATHPPSIGGGDPTMYNYYKGNKNYLLNDNEDNANSNNNFTRNTSASSNADDWGLSFVNKMLGNSVNRQIAWLQNQKNYSRNKKQKTHKYKKVQTKTTPDEDFGDEFINNIFNQFKTAFELKGLQFDKSKLLTEVIDFKNQYAAAFGEEIDLKKEIGILQDRLNLLQGDDVEILKQKIELQEKMNELSEADFKNKLKNKTEGVSTSILESLSEQMKYEHNWDYETPGRRYSVNSDFYKKTTLRGRNANIEESDNELKAKAKKNPDTKDTASKAKGAKDPLETFQNVFGEVQKVGGAMTTIMQTLHIGTDTFKPLLVF